MRLRALVPTMERICWKEQMQDITSRYRSDFTPVDAWIEAWRSEVREREFVTDLAISDNPTTITIPE